MIFLYIDLTDPRFRHDWTAKIQIDLNLRLEAKADDWLASLDDNGEILEPYFKFKAEDKDPEFFPDFMFKKKFVNMESSPAEWWKILHDKSSRAGGIMKEFATIMMKIHSCPASSAAVERWFSTVGFVWLKERNQLGTEKAMKLAQVYRNLWD